MKLSTPVIPCYVRVTPAEHNGRSPVTDAQVADYKRNATAGCQEGGKKQGDPQAQVDAFCGCLLETLNKSMTAAEWRQVVLYSLNKQGEEEVKALTPHLEKVKACLPQQ